MSTRSSTSFRCSLIWAVSTGESSKVNTRRPHDRRPPTAGVARGGRRKHARGRSGSSRELLRGPSPPAQCPCRSALNVIREMLSNMATGNQLVEKRKRIDRRLLMVLIAVFDNIVGSSRQQPVRNQPRIFVILISAPIVLVV